MGGARPRNNLTQGAAGRKPTLLDQVRELLRAKYDSIRTEDAYVSWIRGFILFSDKRHPKERGWAGGRPVSFGSGDASRGESVNAENAENAEERGGEKLCCVTRLRRICWRMAPIFGPRRNGSGTKSLTPERRRSEGRRSKR